MEVLFFIVALVDGPFRGLVGLVLMVPIALITFFLSRRLANRYRDAAARCLRWMPLLCGLALVFALTMDFVRPIRSVQQTMVKKELGKISKQQARAEIDRHYSVKGLMLRGLLHYGPITVIFFGSLGLYVVNSGQRQGAQRS